MFLDNRTLKVDGSTRTYHVFIPAAVTAARPAPLVLALHGWGDDGNAIESFSQLDQAANRGAFMVAYPDAISSGVWNAGLVPNNGAAVGLPDDVKFLLAMIEDIGARQPLDRRRIYVTGHSNGGRMSYRMGCEHADVFAAIAPVAAPIAVACHPSRPIPTLAVQAQGDTVIMPISATGAVESLRAANDCPKTGMRKRIGVATITRYAPCDGGVEVMYALLDGWNHAWPTGAAGYDATAEIASFFARHAATP